jgi:hypothetical protein
MPRCKPGDLAVVVSAHNRANVGRIVHVLRLHDGSGDFAYGPDVGTVWLVRDAGGRRMVWRMRSSNRVWRRRLGPVPDAQLQPIRGEEPSLSDEERLADGVDSPEPVEVAGQGASGSADSEP